VWWRPCSRAQIRDELVSTVLPAERLAHFAQQAQASLLEQARLEEADTLPFEAFRQDYMSARHLVV